MIRKCIKKACLLTALWVCCFCLSAQTWPPDGMQGAGTENNPWQIETDAHLEALALYVNAGFGDETNEKYYKLMSNIDLSEYENWNPIGNHSSYEKDTRFQGVFDGNSKVIRNLKFNNTTAIFGFFGCTDEAIILNLGIANCNIVASRVYWGVGGLVGFNRNSSVHNCYVTGSVSGTAYADGYGFYIGGLVGNNNNSSISNCYSTCHVSGAESNRDGLVGGLVGGNTFSTISNCYATGTIMGNEHVGGVAGSNYESTIENCVAANDKISTINATHINRITGYNSEDFCQNNYALSTMEVLCNGIPVTIIDDLNSEAGMGVDLATLHTRAFYATASHWHNSAWDILSATAVWDICEEKTKPWLRWQNIDCSFFPVTHITDVPATVKVGKPILLIGKVEPYYATNQTIIWSVKDAGTTGATITDNTLSILFDGTVMVTATIIDGAAIGTDYTQDFIINGTGDIHEHPFSMIKIYPNPTSSSFTLEFEGIASLKLYDMLGKELLQKFIFHSTEININHLPKGLYFVKVFSEGKSIGCSKIVKL